MRNNRKTLREIRSLASDLKMTRFPKSGEALVFFVIKIYHIRNSILRCCGARDYYSTCILFRPLLEHYFRHLYIYTRTLRENSDQVGNEYYGKLKGYEDLTYLKSIQGLDKKLSARVSRLKLGSDHNQKLWAVGEKFEIKSILSFLNNDIGDDIKPAFKSFFISYCEKYYNLSSFVHGGPFAEGYISMYSKNIDGMKKDLAYFSKESSDLLNYAIQSTKLFLNITRTTGLTKIYAEIGIGNDSFASTEYETGEKEYRVPRFIRPRKINGYYIRLWIFKKVFILSTNDGFETTLKDRNEFKLVFGIAGEE